jgi:hypothetical protein
MQDDISAVSLPDLSFRLGPSWPRLRIPELLNFTRTRSITDKYKLHLFRLSSLP